MQAKIHAATRRNERELRDARFAMRLSLTVGLAMLVGKTTIYFMTHSAAIFSDAAESVVHVIAVGFAAFSLRLSTKSASPQFLYGYERITFFSAGFEGAMIIVAAVAIVIEAIRKWIAGLQLEHLGTGALLVLAAGLVNAGLGYYLLRMGRRTHSLILEADGKHVLTDSWTSFGVVGGLGLVLLTHWKPFDPLVAIAVAANILWSGGTWCGVRQLGFSIIRIQVPVAKFGISLMQSARNCPLNTMAYASEPPAIARSSKCTCCSRV